MTDELRAARRALFMCACHCQGGHSDAGAEAADVLGIDFPITMPNLIAAARRDGENPAALWRWLGGYGVGKPTDYFTQAEIDAAKAAKS